LLLDYRGSAFGGTVFFATDLATDVTDDIFATVLQWMAND
jgi:hypothetical protein